MVAALVTALGAVMVALVAVLSSRIEARDVRNRLAKDVEIMLKLEPGTDARTTLEKHVDDGALQLAVTERVRFNDRRSAHMYRMAIAYFVVATGIQVAIGGSKQASSVDYLRTLAQPLSVMCLVFAFIALGLSVLAMLIDHRRRSKRRAAAPDAETKK